MVHCHSVFIKCLLVSVFKMFLHFFIFMLFIIIVLMLIWSIAWIPLVFLFICQFLLPGWCVYFVNLHSSTYRISGLITVLYSIILWLFDDPSWYKPMHSLSVCMPEISLIMLCHGLGHYDFALVCFDFAKVFKFCHTI